MENYKELIALLEGACMFKITEMTEESFYKVELFTQAADAIEQLVKERDAAVADLEKCMYYAQPKNNNACNFCKKDMSEYPDKCAGWSDFCKCEPEWRGAKEYNDE